MLNYYNEIFLKKAKEFDKLIKFAARRYSIKGVLDEDDLYQEGLIILNNMFVKYDFDPDSTDFRKMFKTELWHGLWKIIARFKSKKRNFKLLLDEDFSAVEKKLQPAGMHKPVSNDEDSYTLSYGFSIKSPEDIVLSNHEASSMDSFIKKISDRLDSDAKLVFNKLIDPPDWSDIPDGFKFNKHFLSYSRRPSKVPQHIIADMLDWPLIKVRRAVKRIRTVAYEINDELNICNFNISKGGHSYEHA